MSENPVEQQVLVRLQNSLITPDEMHAARTKVVADLTKAQEALLPKLTGFHLADRHQGFSPARPTGGGSHRKGGQ